jgi:hypothetical protein
LTGGFGSGLSTGLTSNTGQGFGGLGFGSSNLQQQQQAAQLQQPSQNQTFQEQPLVQQQLLALSNSPYGNSYHLRSLQVSYTFVFFFFFLIFLKVVNLVFFEKKGLKQKR